VLEGGKEAAGEVNVDVEDIAIGFVPDVRTTVDGDGYLSVDAAVTTVEVEAPEREDMTLDAVVIPGADVEATTLGVTLDPDWLAG
jgi:hypothetical protein